MKNFTKEINEKHKVKVAVFVILQKKNKILLLKRFNTGHKDGFYSFPAGHLEKNESIVEAAIREAKEEVGVTLREKDLQFVHVLHNCYKDEQDNPYLNFYFLVQKWKGEILNMEPKKCDELLWCDMEKLPKNTIGYISETVNKISSKKFFNEIDREK